MELVGRGWGEGVRLCEVVYEPDVLNEGVDLLLVCAIEFGFLKLYIPIKSQIVSTFLQTQSFRIRIPFLFWILKPNLGRIGRLKPLSPPLEESVYYVSTIC